MKRRFLITAAIFSFFLALFFAVQVLGIPLLLDPTPHMRDGGFLTAALGVSLLIADVILPVPSSLVMVAHGALFGVVTGTFLSLLGNIGAALFGFAIGRCGGNFVERIVPAEERRRADNILDTWGPLAVVATRPVPLLAETVAIMAGASQLGWRRMTLAALTGSVPPALLYALTGAAVANLTSMALMFGVIMLVTGSFWLIERLLDPFLQAKKGRPRSTTSRKLRPEKLD